jgi:hypothetical protein
MYMTAERGDDIEPVTEADLKRVLDERSFGSFLILGPSDSEREFLAVNWERPPFDVYRLECPDDSGGRTLATREELTLIQVREVMLEYLRGRDCRGRFSWAPEVPEKVRIPREDDGRFPFAGRLNDGRLFVAFATGAFSDLGKRWIAVAHLFDTDGSHLRSESRLGGYDKEGQELAWERADAELGKLMAPLLEQAPSLGDVYIKPFSVVLDGVMHGLVYDPRYKAAIFHPQDVWFYFPWDTGSYDT